MHTTNYLPPATPELMTALAAQQTALLATAYSNRFYDWPKTTEANLNYFEKWLSMGYQPLPPSIKKGGKSAAPDTAAALENLNHASSEFVEAIYVIPATQTDLTNSISALLAAARKRPVNTAALIAAAEDVVAAAKVIPAAEHYLAACTRAFTAAAKEASSKAAHIPATASADSAEVKNIADFMNACVNTLKNVA